MPNLNDFLLRIQTDYDFYLHFRQNPEEALAPYELSNDEGAAFTGSGEQLSARLGETLLTLTGTKNFVSLGSVDSEFDPKTARARPDVQEAVAQIRSLTSDAERLTPVLALIEKLG